MHSEEDSDSKKAHNMAVPRALSVVKLQMFVLRLALHKRSWRH